MIVGLSDKTKQFFFVLIKLSLVFGAFYFIYDKLTTNPDLNFTTFFNFLYKNSELSLKIVLFLIFLSVFNWFLEIMKWKKLVEYIQPISLMEASKQSLSALTASLITPNRIGDYVAKVIYYPSHQRSRILLLNLLSNMAQMSSTIIFGVIGFLFYIKTYNPNFAYFKMFQYGMLLTGFGLLLLFGLQRTSWSINGFELQRVWNFIVKIPKSIHLKNLGFSMLRYIIFSFQFFVLLVTLGAQLSYTDAMITISSFYLLSSIIPSIFIFDVVIKGGIALYLFGFLGVANLTILTTITLMWILNFVLPSSIGAFFVLRFKSNFVAPTLQNSERL